MPYGIKAMIIGLFFLSAVGFFINTYYMKKLLGYGPFSQIKDFYLSFLLSLFMALIVHFVCNSIHNPIISLSVAIPTGLLVYGVLSYKLNFEQFEELKNIISRKSD